MPDLLKNIYNHESLRELALDIKSVYDAFHLDDFLESTLDSTWDNLELKTRMRQITINLGRYLPKDYKNAISILDKVVENYSGLFGIIFPDFVEVYGLDDANWELSIDALERYTKYSTSEFAVRPFIIKNEEYMMNQMYKWSKNEDEHTRRLASEGCRPQLPWGQALTKYKKDPTPILPILEELKTDSSLYVRKSVANNMNDISKTHPDLIISLAKNWYGKSEYTDWIVKHGCRTLLKKGNSDVLAIFGYHNGTTIEIDNFIISTKNISIGDDIKFSFSIFVKESTKIRLEYGIDYVKSNGKRNRKIFQISQSLLKEGEKKSYIKKHSFANLSTRKHYPGIHSITLIINGVEQQKLDFQLDE